MSPDQVRPSQGNVGRGGVESSAAAPNSPGRRPMTSSSPTAVDKSKTQSAPSASVSKSDYAGAPSPGSMPAVQGASRKDSAWANIWESQQHHIVDPMDVHAVLSDCMARQTNQLSATEITLLQRRVRQVVAALPKSNLQLSTHKMMNRFIIATSSTTKSKGGNGAGSTNSNSGSSGNNGSSAADEDSQDSKNMVEKYHQLDESVFKRVFCVGDALEGVLSVVDPLSSLYTLATYLSSDYLWDRTAAIAQDAAQRAGLILDVNRQAITTKGAANTIVMPVGLKDYLPQEPMDIMGANFASITYLVALALRKLS